MTRRYGVLTVKYVVKYNFAEFRTNHTATKTFFLCKDKSYSNEIIFFQGQIIQ